MGRKPLKGYEGCYEIDENGVIYSVDRIVKNKLGRAHLYKGQLIKPINHPTGYNVVRLSKNGVCKTHRYHRVVAENLIPNPLNLDIVNHKDGDKRNNNPSNLEWITSKGNINHAIEHGLFNPRGVNNGACRFTFEDVSDWYFLCTQGLLIKEIAELYECDRTTITRLIKIEFGDVLPVYRGKRRYACDK